MSSNFGFPTVPQVLGKPILFLTTHGRRVKPCVVLYVGCSSNSIYHCCFHHRLFCRTSIFNRTPLISTMLRGTNYILGLSRYFLASSTRPLLPMNIHAKHALHGKLCFPTRGDSIEDSGDGLHTPTIEK